MNPWEEWSFSSTAMSTWKQWLSSAAEGAGVEEDPKSEALKKAIETAILKPEGLATIEFDPPVSPGPTYPTYYDTAMDQHSTAKTIEAIMQAQIKSVMSSAEMKAKLMGQPAAGGWLDEVYESSAPLGLSMGPTKTGEDDNVHLAGKLIQLVPGLGQKVRQPCTHGGMVSVQTAIMHLNDLHMPRSKGQVAHANTDPNSPWWTRERIADWLDTLDVDLKVQQPGKEPWVLALMDVWEQAELYAVVNGGKPTATIIDTANSRAVRAQGIEAVKDAVKAVLRKNHVPKIHVLLYPQRWVIDNTGGVTHNANYMDEKAMEKVTDATKKLVEALKPLADQVKAAADALSKAIGDNQQLLAAISEVSKMKEDKE